MGARESRLGGETPQDKRAVLVAARATKEKLTSHDHAELACPLADGELAVRVSRERFEAIVQPLVDRTIAAIGRCCATRRRRRAR
jgi:molecular chaperone HscA